MGGRRRRRPLAAPAPGPETREQAMGNDEEQGRGDRGIVLRLVRLIDERTPWASWRVLSGEELVGFVAEDRQWLGHTFGPSSYGAVQNPGCVPFGARWKAEGFATPRAGLEALGRHLCGDEPPAEEPGERP